ncbi:MAG TPA: sigma-70 family RNA polymerase sigma factor [Acidobacteriaceae bacterium]
MPETAIYATMVSVRELGLSVPEQASTELDDIDSLVRLYQARVLRYVMFSINDQDLAETITQDCFLKAYRGRANFRGDCSVSTWLISIASNLVRDAVRTQKFRFWRSFRQNAADVTELAGILPSAGSSPLAAMLAHEQARHVQQALTGLSPNQRAVFLMRFSEEMELQEIAAAMDMKVNTVKTHLHRAVIAIREQLRAEKGRAR